MIELGADRYGKSAIRLVKVTRGPGGNVVRDLTIAIALEGDFGASYTAGDNTGVVATDTMKNTAYAFAKDRLDGSVEAYARALGGHFLEFDQVARATVTVREHRWTPIATPAGPSPDAFSRDPSMTRLHVVTTTRDGAAVEAGVEDLAVMKTAKSSFEGFPRDGYTTLRNSTDRIMATQVSSRWRYASADRDHDALFDGILATMLAVFAEHESPSVQASIWIIGKAILERHPDVEEISFAMPNLHHWLADLAPFGLTNDNEVFIATREPHGLIEATVRRNGARATERA
ncbi:MAG TPA: urate oxidase [Candidatus Acidoferrum sp.]|nr:urate oxidase [Candidatus Acidoferrum sp.]